MSTSTETRPAPIRLLQRAAFVATFDRFAMPPMLVAIAHDIDAPLGSVVQAAGPVLARAVKETGSRERRTRLARLVMR